MMKPLALFWVAGLSLSPACAAEGRTPIWTAPVTISAPGRYFVSRNLSASGGPVIEITAANVDLDLNGMEIRQTTLTVPSMGSSITTTSGAAPSASRSAQPPMW